MSGVRDLYELKEQVRQAVNLVDVARSYMDVLPAGRNFKALCPWHNDTNPSLVLNPERQYFTCWVCDSRGDVFDFVEKIEGVGFMEALKSLADRAGIRIERDLRGSQDQSESRNEKTRLLDVSRWAAETFHRCLTTLAEGRPGREYAQKRGIGEETVHTYMVGFAPNEWDWLLQAARRDQISPDDLETLGLAVPRQKGPGRYDRFKGRLIFPIHDLQGRPIALGGRILPEWADSTPAKYINSPETPLFSKSKVLYGLHHARPSMGRSRTAVVVEGYTDCTAAQQAGLTNVVAVLGTALTEQHLKLLRRFADRIVLVLDGDEAGQRRANDLLGLFVAEQADLRVLTLPDGLDPCDYLNQFGAESLRQSIADAPDALTHKFESYQRRLDPQTDHYEARLAVTDILEVMARAPVLGHRTTAEADAKRHQMIQRVARFFFLPEDDLRRQLGELRRKVRPTGGTKPAPIESDVVKQKSEKLPAQNAEPWETELLELLVERPEAIDRVRQSVGVDQFRDAELRLIYQTMLDVADTEGTADFARLTLALDDPETKQRLIRIDQSSEAKKAIDHASRLAGTLKRVEDSVTRSAWRVQKARLVQGQLDEDEAMRALEQLISSRNQRQGD